MIYFTKLRDVKTPTRGTIESAGIDFYIPEYSEEYRNLVIEKNTAVPNNENGFYIRPHHRILLPAGIKISIPKNTALIAANKSGICSKRGLIFGAQVIDSDYQGEIHLSLINTSNDEVYICYGEKIIQFILTPVLLDNIQEVKLDELYNCETNRAEGGFGSTGIV